MVLIDFSRRRVASIAFSTFLSLSLSHVQGCAKSMTAAWANTHTHTHRVGTHTTRVGTHTHRESRHTHSYALSTYTHTHTKTHLANSKLHKFISSSFAHTSPPRTPSLCYAYLQAICKIDYAHKLKQTSDDIKMLLPHCHRGCCHTAHGCLSRGG